MRGRQADRDLVDDAVVEDVLDVVERAQDGPRTRVVGSVRVECQVADDAQPELSMPFDPIGEPAGLGLGADHQHEVAVMPAIAQRAERQADGDPRCQGHDQLGHEQEDQEQPADRWELEQEQGGEGRHREQQIGAQDVPHLAPDRPA